MCRNMAHIQSVTTEIRQGIKKEDRNHGKYISGLLRG